jgi:hypothetical protein
MEIATKLVASRMFVGTILLLGWLSALPPQMEAQQGDNAVCNSSSPPSGIKCSPAFIDVSVITGSPNNDLCGKIYAVLSSASYPASGTVVDARGVTGAALICASSTTPWSNGTTTVSVPSHILLPSGAITIATAWALPQATHISGEGSTKTTILAASSSVSPMIQMGDANCTFPSSVCFDISVDDLALNGGAYPGVIGIENDAAQELSYVDHVDFEAIEGTGLNITAGGDNSGPYSNLYFTAGTTNVSSATACAHITGVLATRGIRDITCSAKDGTTPQAAIYLDGTSGTIENVHVEGFQDGVLVGHNAAAVGNTLININGAYGAGPVKNVVHISNNFDTTDLAILGVVSDDATNAIQDDVTGTTLTDGAVAMYVLGEGATTNGGGGSLGRTRFTTSPSVPNWGVGSGIPSTPYVPCPTGSLFSNTGGTSGSHNTLYVCEGGG